MTSVKMIETVGHFREWYSVLDYPPRENLLTSVLKIWGVL